MQKPVSDDDKVSWLAIGLGSKYMNFVESQLFNPPYSAFSHFVCALNNHELLSSSYDERKTIDHNLAVPSVKDNAQERRRKPWSWRIWMAKQLQLSVLWSWLPSVWPTTGGSNNFNNNSANQKKDRSHVPQVKQDGIAVNNQSSSFPVCAYCQICGKPNHIAQNCSYRYDYAQPRKALSGFCCYAHELSS